MKCRSRDKRIHLVSNGHFLNRLFFVLRALGRIGVYWVFNWLTLMLSSAVLIFAGWYWAHGADEVLVRTVLGTLVVVALASGLFFMKVTNLRTYASLELLFAAGMATKTMHDLKPQMQPSEMLTLGKSAYLIIRGLDNFKKDLDERKKPLRSATAATA